MTPFGRSSTPYGTDLDAPPPTPADRIKPPTTLPGDETSSILGAPNVNGEGGFGTAANSPTGRALSGVMKIMQGINEVQSVIPGAVPPPFIMMAEKLSQIIPEIVRSMQQQMTGPGGMLSTMGMDPGMGSGMGGGMSGAPPTMSAGEGRPPLGY